MPVIFPHVILGPEMAAPILWAPGIFWFFLLQNPHAHKIPRFRAGGVGSFGKGGVEVPILILMGVGFFQRKSTQTFAANDCCENPSGHGSRRQRGVIQGSSVSWVAKFKGDNNFPNASCQMGVVAKLQGDETAYLRREMSGREVTGRYIGIPVFHGTSLPMDFWTPLTL